MKINDKKYLSFDPPAGSLKNKTGSWRNFRPVVDKMKCINCAICEISCPEGCILQFNSLLTKYPSLKGKYYEADLTYCKGCGICPEVCPVKCIKMKAEK
jgi:pyruvate ferredoxin oxidoreductase delta subunit